MRNEHEIHYTTHPDRLEIARRLREIGVKLKFTGTKGIAESFVFFIYEDDPKWRAVQEVMTQYPPLGDYCGSDFTKNELRAAAWLQTSSRWELGYPQPEGDFGYLNLTYDLTHYCEQCGVGYVQQAPFRVRSEPKWGATRHIAVLFWVYDAFFVRPEVWKAVFEPFGIACRPVLKYRTDQPLDTVVQLTIDAMLPGHLVLDGYPTEVCPHCHTVKYHVPRRCGEFPPMTAVPKNVHAAFSQEYFGSGGQAFRMLFISQALYRHIESHKVKPMEFMPVQENPEAVQLPAIPWAP